MILCLFVKRSIMYIYLSLFKCVHIYAKAFLETNMSNFAYIEFCQNENMLVLFLHLSLLINHKQLSSYKPSNTLYVL